LKPTGPVKIIQPLESQIIKEAETTTLEVKYNKPSETSVRWTHNGKGLEATHTDDVCSILEVQSVDKTRTGTYRVYVGDVCSSATISIYGKDNDGECFFILVMQRDLWIFSNRPILI